MSKPNRLLSVLSTKDHVHGSEQRRTEVPREILVKSLRQDSTLIDTRETAKNELRVTQRLVLSWRRGGE